MGYFYCRACGWGCWLFICFGLIFSAKLIGEYGNASGFWAAGILVSKNGCPMLCVEAEYIDLVDFTGREWHPGKRGVITADEPPALRKLGLDKDHWTMKVKGFGSGYWRVVGSLEELLEKAKELKQRTLFGIGFARVLKKI